ncbi:NAD(P)-dependent oxidoreductase [Saccharopolyspora sp. HNM0986]|uniref:NAD-dependent epimerase/dehydratase family protein n=1 Tax=Saccharopolyspora galaxeae TaxID=2781241 RepID=UPI00190C7CF6|nr:NAD(P)-dependent oxidoreductase [Saccharopolyspora sp. HNM0986]MBK0868993.1 NAD(P)-dependent oxidoreductase [Saccharopolyspora sp. HNM0986]
MNPARTAVVVGGSGFIGRHICQALRGSGWNVVVGGRRGGSVRGCRTFAVRPGPSRTDELAELVTRSGASVVVNSAGAVWDPTRAAFDDSNVRCAEDLALAVARVQPRPWLVHLGSSFEYAPVPRGTALDEHAPTGPCTDYGKSKLAGTDRVLTLAREHNLPAVVLRVFNAIGPDVPPRSLLGRVVSTLRQAQEANQRAEVSLPTRIQWRDWVDVRDVADAVARAAGDPFEREPEVVNIGGGVATDTGTLVRELVQISGVAANLRSPGVVDPGVDDGLDWQCADIAHAHRRWGWRPARSLHRTLHDLWDTAERRT